MAKLLGLEAHAVPTRWRFSPFVQASLEREWKREMFRLYGVSFDSLYCITNMPTPATSSGSCRVAPDSISSGWQGLQSGGSRCIMCRTTLSVGWDGRLYDCDFNQISISASSQRLPHIDASSARRRARRIVVRVVTSAALPARDRAAPESPHERASAWIWLVALVIGVAGLVALFTLLPVARG